MPTDIEMVRLWGKTGSHRAPVRTTRMTHRRSSDHMLSEGAKITGGEIVEGPLELLTERLRLRTPQIDDADAIQSIVSDPRVALTTASIPHPYPEGGAKGFLLHVQKVASRDRRNLAIILRDGNELIGMVGYQTEGLESELAYMVSPIHWGLGYASEACRRIVAYIFDATEAKAVVARAMADNEASKAVLRKGGAAMAIRKTRWASDTLWHFPNFILAARS